MGTMDQLNGLCLTSQRKATHFFSRVLLRMILSSVIQNDTFRYNFKNLFHCSYILSVRKICLGDVKT